MDKIDLHLRKLLNKALVPHPYGEKLFNHYDIPRSYGMDICSQYDKHYNSGKFFLVEWVCCSCDVRLIGGEIGRGCTKYVNSYWTFDNEREFNCAYLILKDKGLTFNNFNNSLSNSPPYYLAP